MKVVTQLKDGDIKWSVLDKSKRKEVFRELKKAFSSIVDFYREFLCPPKKYLEPAPFHWLINDILIYGKENFAIESFRESGKTSLSVIAYPIWLLTTRTEDFYLVIIKENIDHAESKLREIKALVSEHDILKYVIKEVRDDRAGSWEFKNVHNALIRIEVYGKGSSIRGLLWRGRRPDLIILDDVQSVKDLESDRLLEKSWDWFLSDIRFLSKEARIFIIGNNLGEKCIIERLMKSAKEFNFRTLRIPAMVEKDGKLYATWKEKIDVPELLKEREAYIKEHKLDIWVRERMCQVGASESKPFNADMIMRYDRIPPLHNKNVFISVDLATTEEKDSNYTGIVVIAVSKDNVWWILDVKYGKWNINKAIDVIFDMVKKWNPLALGIEKGMLTNVVKPILQREMQERNMFFRVHPVQYKKKSKKTRIEGLTARYKEGRVYHPPYHLCPAIIELERELLSFPFGQYDDVIDALANFEFFAYPP